MYTQVAVKLLHKINTFKSRSLWCESIGGFFDC